MKDLYHPIIIKHSKSPSNFIRTKSSENRGVAVEAYNPLCGDEFTLYVYAHAGQIDKIEFSGYGCAVSKSMTSILTESLAGKDAQQALSLMREVKRYLMTDELVTDVPQLFEPFKEVRKYPERMTCATLSMDALIEYLESTNQ